jgi:hypothetical protein
MTVTVANVALTNTVDFWINRTNELSTAMTIKAVTTDSNTAVGNAAITGTFSANVIKVGNTTVNTTISAPNTAQISSGEFFLNANGSWAEATGPISNGTIQTSGLTVQNVDQYVATSIKAAEYSIHVRDNTANAFQLSKILTLHTGPSGNAFSTEYCIVTSNGVIATFSANVFGANVILTVVPNVSNTTISFTRIRL